MVISPEDVRDADEVHISNEFRKDVEAGLKAEQKFIPSKYLYDDQGSRLYQKIMDLPEYYLFKAEKEILEKRSRDLAFVLGSEPVNIVELGVGDGKKTSILLSSFMEKGIDFNLTVIDISQKALQEFTDRTRKENQVYPVRCVNTDYVNGLKLLHKKDDRRLLVLFLGSSIGNFTPDEEESFLKRIRSNLDERDHMLIGFDLTTDPQKLLPAYNDSEGVTREFNLNLLKRINRELGADFDLNKFEHVPLYDPVKQQMESYIQSKKDQTVKIKDLDMEIEFLKGEKIHTEISRKYSIEKVGELAERTGFEKVLDLFNREENFVLSLWTPEVE
ncbi:MAG: L-histidine N(alpha)-methyltransferase [Archaeoglobaceae archaeon]